MTDLLTSPKIPKASPQKGPPAIELQCSAVGYFLQECPTIHRQAPSIASEAVRAVLRHSKCSIRPGVNGTRHPTSAGDLASDSRNCIASVLGASLRREPDASPALGVAHRVLTKGAACGGWLRLTELALPR